MQLSFYDASIMCYEQILQSTANVLKAGREHADTIDMPLSDIVDYRLHETMNPFSFQVISVWHHSYGAVQGMRAGEFNPPPSKSGIDYAGLCDLIDEGLAELRKETPESMSKFIKKWGENCYINIVGGCCGATPEHIKLMKQVTKNLKPRKRLKRDKYMRLSGLEAFNY